MHDNTATSVWFYSEMYWQYSVIRFTLHLNVLITQRHQSGFTLKGTDNTVSSDLLYTEMYWQYSVIRFILYWNVLITQWHQSDLYSETGILDWLNNEMYWTSVCFGCLSGPPGFTCWISFAPVFSLIYCGVLILALSPCYILIYMF